MKKTPVLFIIAFLAVQVPAFAEDLNIAVIHTGKVLAVTLAGKQMEAQVQSRTTQLRKEIEKADVAFKAEIETFQRQQSALSLESRRLKEIELKRRQNELKEMFAAFRQADQAARKELTPALVRFLEKASAEYLKGAGYNLVIDHTRGTLAYYDLKFDVTDEVIKHCDKAWKAKGN